MEPVEVATHDEVNATEIFCGEHGEWSDVCDLLRASVGDDAFQRWFRAAAWAGQEDGVGTVTVPGEIHQVWVETNYLPELSVAVNRVFRDVREVRVAVADVADTNGQGHFSIDGLATRKPREPKAPEMSAELLDRRIKSSGLNSAYTFSSFVVGTNSQFAHAACLAVANKTGVGYNPLFIHGGPGLGKTHLMQAIGQEILKLRPASRVVYLTCEKFTNEFIDSVRRGDLEGLVLALRCGNLLLQYNGIGQQVV